MFWCTLLASALAQDAVTGNDVGGLLLELQGAADASPLLVGAAGFDAKELVDDQVAATSGLNVEVRRLSDERSSSAAALERWMAKLDRSCAVMVRFVGFEPASFFVRRQGRCGVSGAWARWQHATRHVPRGRRGRCAATTRGTAGWCSRS